MGAWEGARFSCFPVPGRKGGSAGGVCSDCHRRVRTESMQGFPIPDRARFFSSRMFLVIDFLCPIISVPALPTDLPVLDLVSRPRVRRGSQTWFL